MAGPYGTFLYGADVYGGPPVLDAFTYELGTYEGRIKPVSIVPPDGNFVFCLGSDKEPAQVHDVAFGDSVYIEQSIDLTDVNFVRASWYVRQAEDMPDSTAVVGPALLVGDVLALVDPAKVGDDLLALTADADTFTLADVRRTVRIADASNGGNNGDKIISGVLTARIAILDDGVVAEEDPLGGGLGTATLLGARWRASLLVGGTERAWVVEHPRRGVSRIALQAHVSKLSGAQTVRFLLQLEEA